MRKEEGIEFKLLNNPVKINGDGNGWVDSVTCIKMELESLTSPEGADLYRLKAVNLIWMLML